VTYQILCT
jgi:MFS family permease